MKARPIACMLVAVAASGAFAADPVQESFDRMFNHEPSAVSPQPPGTTPDDPLRATLTAVLWTGEASFHAPPVVASAPRDSGSSGQ